MDNYLTCNIFTRTIEKTTENQYAITNCPNRKVGN